MNTQHDAQRPLIRGKAAQPFEARFRQVPATQQGDAFLVTHWTRILHYDVFARPDTARPTFDRSAARDDAPSGQQRRARNRRGLNRTPWTGNRRRMQGRFAAAGGMLGLSLAMYVAITAALHAVTVSHAASSIDTGALTASGSRHVARLGAQSNRPESSQPAILVPHVDEIGSTGLQDMQVPMRSSDVPTD